MSNEPPPAGEIGTIEGITPEELREKMLEGLPSKTLRKRAKQVMTNDPDAPKEIGANSRTIPGIMTQRGCTYAGCRGVVIGPIYDILHITHGPIGCGYYSWLTRRNLVRPVDGEPNFLQYSMITDMQEEHIVFGGEKRLAEAIREAYALFKPKAISVYSTCPVGLIGDDIHTVCRVASEELGINIFGFSCEGYKGVSQSAGHHIANNGVFKHMIGRDDVPVEEAPFKINVLGEYNIGGDAWEIDTLLRKCGITVLATLSGNVSYDEITKCHQADLNVVTCNRSINYMAEVMETKFGIPWFKVNFIGAESTAKSLRKIAKFFDNKELDARVEEVIAAAMAAVRPIQTEVKAKHMGKKAALFVGGSRAHHYQDLFSDIGMETISAGYEFAHRDDYEGRDVLPSIKVDADSRNIEEIHVDPDPERFRPRLSPKAKEKLIASGFTFSDCSGMMSEMKKRALAIDDISHYELEKLIEHWKPDIIGSGIKDKYIVEKMGVPCKQLHSYDYGGPYAAFAGAINFYKEVDRMLFSKVWSYVVPPWVKDRKPVETPGIEEPAVA